MKEDPEYSKKLGLVGIITTLSNNNPKKSDSKGENVWIIQSPSKNYTTN